MKASILIASYQRPAMLQHCLSSLLLQTRPPDEVIVVTKAHDPGSAQAVQDFAREHQPGWPLRNVQVVELPIVAAENAGLRAASGDVVCFTDDDAVARPDWLDRILAHYQDDRAGAVGGRDVLYVEGVPFTAGQPGRVGELTWYGRMYGNHHLGADGVREVHFLKGVNMSVRRALVSAIDPALRGEVTYHWEDDLCLSVRARGYRVIYDPQAIVDHYAGRSMEERALASARTLYENNHNATYVLLKYLPAGRKAVALLYTLLVGDGNAWGVAAVIRQIALRKYPPSFIRVLGPLLAGKMAGLRSYWSWRRAKPAVAGTGNGSG